MTIAFIVTGILYALGLFFAMIYFAVQNMDSGSGPPATWGPVSKWIYKETKRSDSLRHLMFLLVMLFWPLTLPAYMLKW